MKEQILSTIKGRVKYNGEGGKEHEQSIADILISMGFLEVDRKGLTNKQTKSEIQVGNFDNVDMPANSFVREPLGCRAPVDFLINSDEIFVLEAKSSKGGVVQWNDNPPKPYFYYIVSVKGEGNTVFKGTEWISEENVLRFISVGETLKNVFNKDIHDNPDISFSDVVDELEKAFNDAKALTLSSGFRYNPRRMCLQDSKHFKLKTKGEI